MTEEKLKGFYETLKKHKENDFQELYDMGYKLEGEYGCCGQCTVYPFVKLIGVDEQLFQLASGYCAGIGLVRDYTCGAFNGSVLLLSYFFGRDVYKLNMDVQASKDYFRNTCRMVRMLKDQYEELYGSIVCKNIQTKLFGRSFDLLIPEDYTEFEAQGGHTDKCTSIVGTANKLVARIIYDELDSMFGEKK